MVRTNRSWPSVRGWKARATSTGTGSTPSSGAAPEPAAGTSDVGGRRVGRRRARRGPASPPSPAFQASRSAARRVAACGAGRRLDLGRGQQVGERVEVVADADPALGAGLERRRAATGERVEDDVAGPRVAGDERVGEGGREAREVRAHRVERSGPTAAAGPSTRARWRVGGSSSGSSRASWPVVRRVGGPDIVDNATSLTPRPGADRAMGRGA